MPANTKKQQEARKRFKKKIQEAKAIRQKNPTMPWREAIKQAFAK